MAISRSQALNGGAAAGASVMRVRRQPGLRSMPSDIQWKCAAIQIGAKITEETQVVLKNLRLSCGSTGEAGSPPPGVGMPASAWLTAPTGRIENSTTHQTIR